MTYLRLIPIWLASLLFLYQHMSPSPCVDLGIRISPDRLLFILILGLFLKNRGGRLRLGVTEGFMLAFAGWCTLSWLVTQPDAGASKLRWLTTIFQLAYFPFGIFVVAKNSDYSERDIKHLLTGVLIIQSYLVFNGLAEHFNMDLLVWPNYILNRALSDQGDRLNGPFSNSGYLGVALVMNFGCLCLIALWVRGFKRVCVYSLMILSCGCIYLTYTRTVWLGFFAMLAVFYFFRTGLRLHARRIGLCVLALALTGAGSKFSLYGPTLFSRRQNTVQYRVTNLQVGLGVFRENPICGVGYGRFAKEMSQFEDRYGDGETRTLTSGNENTWLGILVETGLVGLALYGITYFLLLRSSLRLLKQRRPEHELVRPLAALGFTMVIYMMINWNTGDMRFHLYDPNLAFLVQGVIASLARRATKRAAAMDRPGATAQPGARAGQETGECRMAGASRMRSTPETAGELTRGTTPGAGNRAPVPAARE